jgi:hypothetical protein
MASTDAGRQTKPLRQGTEPFVDMAAASKAFRLDENMPAFPIWERTHVTIGPVTPCQQCAVCQKTNTVQDAGSFAGEIFIFCAPR